MAKAPWKLMSYTQLEDRLRRTPSNSFHRRSAKRLMKDDKDSIGAIIHLIHQGDCKVEHLKAHKRWLDTQAELSTIDPADLA